MEPLSPAAGARDATRLASGGGPIGGEPEHRDIIVVGASAGGIEALDRLVRGLPPELPAAVFVVLHLHSPGTSVLASILDRAGKLTARPAADGDLIERGQVYVAPPDVHLLIEDSV